MCVYFSSLNNNISPKRRKNLIEILDNIKLSYEYDNGVSNGTTTERMYYHILEKMKKFKYSKYKYALICDDDFYPCNDFWNKLLTTLKYIERDFRCLHLCPGCLWGRKYRNKDEIGQLNEEYNLFGLVHNKYVFYNINKKIWINKKMWLGGPVAFLVNRENINSLIDDYSLFWKKYKVPNDVILLNILNNKDYVCRDPQLGYEREEGGSMF